MFDSTKLTQDQIDLLAQYWTYQETTEQTDGEGNTTQVPNPQSVTEFINERFTIMANNCIQEQYNRNLLSGVRGDEVPLISIEGVA